MKSLRSVNYLVGATVIFLCALWGCDLLGFGDKNGNGDDNGEPVDTEPPVITEFTLTSNNPTAHPAISFTIVDDMEVEGFLINESSEKPSADNEMFVEAQPTAYTLSTGYGEKTVYVWAKDHAGNVSDGNSLTVSYLEPGGEIWSKSFDGGGDDVAYSVAFDGAGNIYVVGDREDAGDRNWWLKKLDSDGQELAGWDKNIDSGLGADIAYSVAVRPNEPYSVLVAGQAGADWWLKKYQPDGTEIMEGWNQRIDGGGADGVYANYIDGSGNCYVLGHGESLVGATAQDWWIRLFQSSGTPNSDWNKKFDGGFSGDDRATSMATDDANGYVYVAGYLSSGSDYDWWLKKFRPWGAEVAAADGGDKKIDSGLGDDFAYGMVADDVGNLYVVGEAAQDWWLVKLGADGTQIAGWDKKLDGGGADTAYAVALDPFKKVYVVGKAAGDWAVKKFEPDGTEITTGWNKKISAGSDAAAYDLVVDQSGYVYVVGYGTDLVSATSGRDWWIKKFFDDRP